MISAPSPRKVSAEMSRTIRFIAIAIAVLALALFLAAIWIHEHTYQFFWSGIIFLFAAICVSAFGTPVKK